ncbi:MAG: glycosyltransferase [Pseudomonadota bacterium]
MDLSVIIPAQNEAGYIGRCLAALAAQRMGRLRGEVIVSANACTDGTVREARALAPHLAAAGWEIRILERAEPGKPGALNAADAVARGATRIYLDADVILDPAMVAALHMALATEAPRYASGTLEVAEARSWVTRHFSATWQRLPFMASTAPGAGLFAVNRAGRARWGAFPDIISDDGFARLSFGPEERVQVAASYSWPLVEGFRGLVRVRRRQDAGMRELARRYPGMLANEGKSPLGARDHARLFAAGPVSYAVYAFVILAVRLGGPGRAHWVRGR